MKKSILTSAMILLGGIMIFGQNKLTPEILWKFKRLGEAQLSPDGSKIVYNITTYFAETNKRTTDLFIVSVNGKEQYQLTDFEGAEFNIRWYPDGSRIGFLCSKDTSVQLWEISPDGKTKKQITEVKGGLNSFEYSPDGKSIFYTQDVKVEQDVNDRNPDLPLAKARVYDDLMPRHWNQWNDASYSHIFIAAYTGEKIKEGKDLMKGEAWDAPLSPFFDNTEMTWSPDGKIIAYTCKKMKGKEYATSTNSDIYLYYPETSKTENITAGMGGYEKYPVFSPDGKIIAFQSMETPGYESDKERLFIYRMDTKQMDYLTNDFDYDVSNIVWDKEGNTIFFLGVFKGTVQVFSIDIKTKKTTQITKGIHDYTAFSMAGNIMMGVKESISMASEIYTIDKKTGKETQLTFMNSDMYAQVKMGKVEERWVKTTDQKNMQVWMIYPPDFDSTKTYPALLFCQGGPHGAISQRFHYRWNFQLMASYGYIIIAPNRRGLPSFGEEWNDQIVHDWGGQNQLDYLSAVDDVKKEPYVDKDRLGAIGASYGGYSIFWLAGHHEKRFKAFISHCGIYNFESMYAATEEIFFSDYEWGGPYWKKPQPPSYRSFSPHNYVQNWDTPILIITGEHDYRVPYTQSLEAFTAARLVGVDARLMIFPEETHFVLKPQNAILWWREWTKWMEQKLK